MGIKILILIAVIALGIFGLAHSGIFHSPSRAEELLKDWLTAEKEGRSDPAGRYWWDADGVPDLHPVAEWEYLKLPGKNQCGIQQHVKVAITSAHPLTGAVVRENYMMTARVKDADHAQEGQPLRLSTGILY